MRPAVVVILSLFLANCATDTTKKTASGNKYGVKASPKVIADGEPVPKGGGYDMVGKPYTVGGKLYVPREDKNYSATGTASWYGPSFHGRMTANGEVFDRESISVAHPTLPLPSYVRVTNVLNGRSIIARVNDRGPFHGNRLVDVSEQVAIGLNFKHLGTARLKVDYIGRAPVSTDDTAMLLASLRTDGTPAQLGRGSSNAVVALAKSAAPAVPARSEAIETAVSANQPESQFVAGEGALPLPPQRPFSIGETGFRPHFSPALTSKTTINEAINASADEGKPLSAPVLTSSVQTNSVQTNPVSVPLPPARPDSLSANGASDETEATGSFTPATTPAQRFNKRV